MVAMKENEGCKMPELKIPPSLEPLIQEALQAKAEVEALGQAFTLAVTDALRDVAQIAMDAALAVQEQAQSLLFSEGLAREIQQGVAFAEKQARTLQSLLSIPCPLPKEPDTSLDALSLQALASEPLPLGVGSEFTQQDLLELDSLGYTPRETEPVDVALEQALGKDPATLELVRRRLGLE